MGSRPEETGMTLHVDGTIDRLIAIEEEVCGTMRGDGGIMKGGSGIMEGDGAGVRI